MLPADNCWQQICGAQGHAGWRWLVRQTHVLLPMEKRHSHLHPRSLFLHVKELFHGQQPTLYISEEHYWRWEGPYSGGNNPQNGGEAAIMASPWDMLMDCTVCQRILQKRLGHMCVNFPLNPCTVFSSPWGPISILQHIFETTKYLKVAITNSSHM